MQNPYSVVHLVLDDCRREWGHLGGFALTPVLDQLAGEPRTKSLRRFYAGACQCKPTRSTFSSGVPPHVHGQITNHQQVAGAPGAGAWLAGTLQAAGWHTKGFGKRHRGDLLTAEAEGFDHWENEAEISDVLGWIGNQQPGGDPFYLEVGLHEPHSPWMPGQTMLDRYPGQVSAPVNFGAARANMPAYFDHREVYHDSGTSIEETLELDGFPLPIDWNQVLKHYYASISTADKKIGRIVQALEKAGLRGEVLLIVTSDQGQMVYTLRLTFKGPFGFEPMIGIPCLIQAPFPIGALDENAIYEQIDLAPTILEALGVPIPESMIGRPFTEGGKDFAVLQSRIDFGPHAGEVRILRTATHTLVLRENDLDELYDTEADPHQLENLGDQGPVYAAMRAQLEAWMDEHEDPARLVFPDQTP